MAKKKKEEVIPEVVAEIVPTEEVVAQEIVLNVPAPEVEAPGHSSRDFKSVQ